MFLNHDNEDTESYTSVSRKHMQPQQVPKKEKHNNNNTFNVSKPHTIAWLLWKKNINFGRMNKNMLIFL